jgi:hypothetical protein
MASHDGPGSDRHITEDECVDLLHGLLTDAARSRAIAHASQCAECDGRLREFAGVHERGRALAARVLESGRPSPMPDADRGGSLAVRTARGGAPAGPWLAAAMLVIAAGVGWFMLRPKAVPDRRAELVWLPSLPASGHLRASGDARADSLVSAGVSAYDRRELASAESLLATSIASGSPSLEWVRRLYLANTLIALGRGEEAMPLFEARGAESIPEPWSGDWNWTYLVALQQTGASARADSLLKVLQSRPGKVGERARELASSGPTDH